MTTRVIRTSPAAQPPGKPRGRLARLLLGRAGDPAWARPLLWAVLVLAGVLYCWDLSRNGDANSFYAASVLSGTESWKAFFYGSLDSASFITVDKPPFAFWVMGISARVFGFDSWSLLVPQAAEGVATVAVVYAAVRRSAVSLTGERGAHAAGLLAALALTLTPVVVAINRDDNPDTTLTLLLAIGAWGLLESLRASRIGREPAEGVRDADTTSTTGGRRGHPLLWLMVSAVAFGLAFNTKMLAGFIALPALAAVYLIAAKGRFWSRFGRLVAPGAVLAVISLSWMTVVDLISKSSRPYVGSSTNDTEWNLAVDYNGFGRITGNEGAGGRFGVATREAARGTGAGAGTGFGRGAAGGLAHRAAGGGFGGFSGQSGIGRMFGATLGGQISWLIPLAAIALIGTLFLIGRRPRTDLARASVLLWGIWLLLEFGVLSFQQGIQHSYYTNAMAPPIAALAGIGVVAFYQAFRRRAGWWSLLLPVAIAVTGIWSFVLLRRTPSWNPWLSWVVLAATIVTVAALGLSWLGGRADRGDDATTTGRRRGGLLALAGVAGLVAALAGPFAYSLTPLAHTIEGVNPTAGPTTTAAFGGGGGFGTGRDGLFGRDGAGGREGPGSREGLGGRDPGRLGGGGLGGEDSGVSKQLLAYLEAHRDGATWLAAVRGSSAAAGIILQSGGIPVMAMGGFTGTDPAPTLAQFEQYVKEGKVRYVLTGGAGGAGGFGGAGGNGTVSTVTSWVEQHCTTVPASAYGGSTSAAQTLYLCG